MIKKYFSDEDDSDEEDIKNELLKTIYFPKGVLNIGYLTDKLPKPVYDHDFGSLTERKSVANSNSSSSLFPAIKSNSPIIKRHYKQGRNQKETKSTESVPSIKNKNSPNSNDSNKPNASSPVHSSNKLTSIERIANKIEENKIDNNSMNIDKEYNDLKQILKKQERVTREKNRHSNVAKSSDKINLNHRLELNRSPRSKQVSSLLSNGKHSKGEGVLYTVKGKNKYRNNIITKSHRELNLVKKYKNLQMGIVGEPIIGSTNRLQAMK